MKKNIVLALSLLLLCVSCAKEEKEPKLRVHSIGDSTMADYVENTTRTRGWGEMLQEFFSPEVQVMNYARGGRSSRSFYQEGRWKMVTDNLQAGDYVLIQFAHNDEKEGGKDGADGRGTAPWTTYKSYIERYVDETRAMGGQPVLVTPIVRRYFTKDGSISPKGCHDLSKAPDDSTLNYVRVMKQVARDKQVPLVDMTAMTKAFVENLGEQKTVKCIYVPTDGTHTQATGAAYYAALAVEGLASINILNDYIRQDLPLVLNPTSLDFKSIFVGENAVLPFDLVAMNLLPEKGDLVIQAPKGMLIAESPDAEPTSSLSLSYEDGQLWNQCFYVHFTPKQAKNYQAAITIKYGKEKRLLPVKAEVKAVQSRESFSVDLDKMSFRSLQSQDDFITIEGKQWSAEIDEAQKRYVEVILPPAEQTRVLQQLSFTLEGGIAYRVACAYGKDFYPRVDLGEIQTPKQGSQRYVYPMNISLNPGQALHIRLYPWSVEATDDLSFQVKDWKVEGSIIQ